MTRHLKKVVVAEDNRDKGKIFHLKEMDAVAAEDWAYRVFLGLTRNGADVPEDILTSGFAGVARLGLKCLAGLQIEEARPILAELMTCVTFQPDPAKPDLTRKLFPEDIEEPKTLMFLKAEVFNLHTGFSAPGVMSYWI